MSMDLAVTSLLDELDALTWARLQTTNSEPGSDKYTISVTYGGYREEYAFGATRKFQTLDVSLFTKVPSSEMFAKIQAINEVVTADRRRGGYAQSSTINAWEADENIINEGAKLLTTIEIQIQETN